MFRQEVKAGRYVSHIEDDEFCGIICDGEINSKNEVKVRWNFGLTVMISIDDLVPTTDPFTRSFDKVSHSLNEALDLVIAAKETAEKLNGTEGLMIRDHFRQNMTALLQKLLSDEFYVK